MISFLIIVQIELQPRLITLIKECVLYCVGWSLVAELRRSVGVFQNCTSVCSIKRKKVVTDRSRHSYTAFIFTGNDDVETTLSLTCNIVACLESECSSLISECSRRKRRSAVPQNQQYTTTVTKVFRKWWMKHQKKTAHNIKINKYLMKINIYRKT